jgi:hypothetical protein
MIDLETMEIDHLQTWVGRKEVRNEIVTFNQAAQLAALFDWPAPPQKGDILPCLWHWANPAANPSSVLTGIRHAAVSCRRCSCRGGCGRAGTSPSLTRFMSRSRSVALPPSQA